MNDQSIQIDISKSKLVKLLLGCLAFVAICSWILIYQPEIGNPVFDNVIVKYGVMATGVLFFGLLAFFYIRKLGDNKAGIVIDDNGIFDNSSALAAGFIPWVDVKQVKTVEVSKQKLLMIIVNNPADYISRRKNIVGKKAMAFNERKYGSPVSITANALKCSTDELYILIERKRREMNG